MNEKSLHPRQLSAQAESDQQVDAIFDGFLDGVGSFGELDVEELDLISRLLPEGFNLSELEEVIKNRIALGIGKTSVSSKVE